MTTDEPVEARPVVKVVENAKGGSDYWLWCPACDDAVRIDSGWEWDGNLEAPTFAPSILTQGWQQRPKVPLVHQGRSVGVPERLHTRPGWTDGSDGPAASMAARFVLGVHAMTDPSPSVPVESREQPSGDEDEIVVIDESSYLSGPVHMFGCGKCSLLEKKDATIRELRAEVERLRSDLNAIRANKETHRKKRSHWFHEWQEAVTERQIARAERDRALDLAAHLEDEVAEANSVGPEIAHAIEGQRVSVIFDGVFVRTNPETHGLVIKGNARGAQHIDWTMEFHWAAELFEPTSALAAHLEAEQAETEE